MLGQSLGELFVRIGIDPSALASGTSAVESQLERVGTRLYFMGSRIAVGFGAPLLAVTGAVAKFGVEFDQAMTESLAIMDNVTPKIRARMEEQARAITETTKFSAIEGAKAYYELASAGLNASETVGALPIVARFAQAGLMELGKATEYLAGTTAALGLKTKDTNQYLQNMVHVSDVLTTVNNLALGHVQDFAQGLERAGGTLRIFHKDVEEGAAVLAAFAEQGIKGNVAGTALHMMLRDLSTAALKHADAWRAAGIAVFDSNGKMRNTADILHDMEARFNGLSDAQIKNELIQLKLQDRSSRAILTILGMSDAIREWEAQLRSAGGATQQVADKQMASLENRLLQMYHQLQNIGINLFGSFRPVIEGTVVPAMQSMVAMLGNAVRWFETLSYSQKSWVLGMVGVGVSLGVVITALGSFLLLLRALSAPVTALITLFTGLSASYAANATAALINAGATKTLAEALVGELSVAQLNAIANSEKTAAQIASLGAQFARQGRDLSTLAFAFEADAVSVGVFGRALGVLTSPITWIIGGIAAMAYGLKEMTGTWAASIAFMSPPIQGIRMAWDDLTKSYQQNGQVFRDLWSIAKDSTVIGSRIILDFLGRVKTELINTFNNQTAPAFREFGSLFSGLGSKVVEFGRNVLSTLPEFRELVLLWMIWKSNTADLKGSIHDLANALHMVRGEAGSTGPLSSKTLPFLGGLDVPSLMSSHDTLKQRADERARQLLLALRSGGEDLGGGGMPPSPTPKREQAIIDRVTGKKAIEDAEDWAKAIEKIGGYGKLAQSDLKAAFEVFNTAADHLERMGKGSTVAAQQYRDLANALREADPEWKKTLTTLSRIEDASKALTKPIPDMGLYKPIWDMFINPKTIDRLHDVEATANAPMDLFHRLPNQITASQITKSVQPFMENFNKFWKQTVDGLGKISQEFDHLASITDGSFSKIAKAIGSFLAILSIAGRAGEGFGASWKEWNKPGVTGMDKFGAVWGMAQNSLAAWGSITAATNFRSTGANVASGALTGAQFGVSAATLAGAKAGSAAGWWGAAAGAIAGAIIGYVRSHREWVKLSNDIARDMGVRIDDDLAKKLADESKVIGRQATEVLHLKEILESGGGLSVENVRPMLAKLHDVFSLIAQGQLSAAQGSKILNDNFQTFVDAATSGVGVVNAKITQLIQLNDQYGTHSKTIADFVFRQADLAFAGFQEFLANGIPKSREAAEALAGSLVVVVDEMRAQGAMTSDIFQKILPWIQQLQTKLKAAGVDGGDAFNSLVRQAKLFSDSVTGKALRSIEGLGKILLATANMGGLTEKNFKGLADQIGATIQKMLDSGKNRDDVLSAAQSQLQILWELEQQYGFMVDDVTQSLIDQALAEGKIGEKFKGPQQQIIDALTNMDQILAAIAKKFGADLPASVQKFLDSLAGLPGAGGGGTSRPPSPPPPIPPGGGDPGKDVFGRLSTSRLLSIGSSPLLFPTQASASVRSASVVSATPHITVQVNIDARGAVTDQYWMDKLTEKIQKPFWDKVFKNVNGAYSDANAALNRNV